LSVYVGKMFTSDFESLATWAYFDKVRSALALFARLH